MAKSVVLVTISLNTVAGGLERNLVLIANHLSAKYSVSIVSFDLQNAESFFELKKDVQWHKIGVSQPHKRIKFKDRLFSIFKLRKLLVGADNPIVIGFHHGLNSRLLAVCAGIPAVIVISERNSISLYNYIKLSKWNINFCLLFFVSKITVQFESYIQKYPWYLRKKIIAIPNSVEKFSEEGRTSANSKLATRSILCVGRLETQKQFDHVIKAFEKCSKKLPGWTLLIVGEGEHLQALLDLLERTKLTSRVRIIPNQRGLKEIYSCSSIFVTTSMWEGFPNALAEALLQGLPAIGYENCDGVNNLIIDKQNGFLVKETKSHDELANAIMELASNRNRYVQMSKAATNSVSKFEPQVVLREWECLIESL